MRHVQHNIGEQSVSGLAKPHMWYQRLFSVDVSMRTLDSLKWVDYNNFDKVSWCADEGKVSNSTSIKYGRAKV